MLNSIPVPFQAILWPLAGAALILALSRWLPNWARRLVAFVAALTSFVVLWSLRAGGSARVEIVWGPLNFFRMSPVLGPDGLALLFGILLAGVGAACVLGIQGTEPRRTSWHGWFLVALAGCLAMVLAANLLALALGSALIDLALVAMVLSSSGSGDPGRRLPLSMAVPGIASTLVLFLSALRMDGQVGHASLLARNQEEMALVLMGVAGVLRSLVYPLHPRGLQTAEKGATLLLPAGAGLSLLARVQALMPALSDRLWLTILAVVALLAGGLLVWSSGSGSASRRSRQPVFVESWLGLFVHQVAYALTFVLLLPGATPWPVVSLMLALGIVAIWWDGCLYTEELPRPRWSEWSLRQARLWWAKVQPSTTARIPYLARLSGSWLGRYGAIFLPAIALASLAGLPFTVGAAGRWAFYAAWLRQGDPFLLIALAADTFLVAGLWIVMAVAWEQVAERRPRPSSVLAMIFLAIPVVIVGLAPGMLRDGLGLKAPEPLNVSVWGLGLLYVLPWLLGTWLAGLRGRLARYQGPVREVTELAWLDRGAGWVGQRLIGAAYWLGRVGEGEGWWGWALTVLALGVILLLAR